MRNAETAPEYQLSPEYIATSLEVIELYFRSKQKSLLESYGKPDEVETKPDGSFVTPRDKEVEQELKDLLSFVNPSVGFAGEEFGIEGSSEAYWLIDPIDSTKSFINGVPYCTNMAALVYRGTPVAAVVFEFAGEPAHMFTATEKDGAKVDGQPLMIGDSADSSTIWIDSKDQAARETLYREAEEKGLIRSELPPPNGFRLTRLAKGELGAQVYTNADAGVYDLVPGLFIAQKAGVTVKNIGSDTWDPTNLEVIAYTSEDVGAKVEAMIASSRQ